MVFATRIPSTCLCLPWVCGSGTNAAAKHNLCLALIHFVWPSHRARLALPLGSEPSAGATDADNTSRCRSFGCRPNYYVAFGFCSNKTPH
jgi:hypothetical protein